VIALLALALASAPGCPAALAEVAELEPATLAARATAVVERLDASDAGGPVEAIARAAQEAERAARTPEGPARAAAAFAAALSRHCALAALPRSPDPSAADRERLGEILARPELSRSRGDPWAVRRALLALWARLLDALGSAEAERYASFGRALFLGVAVAAVVLAAAALRRRVGDGLRPAARPGDGVHGGAAVDDGSAARAEEALLRGDGREAVRWAFLGALGAMERAGWVPGGRALTNAEVVAIAGTAIPTQAGPFALSGAPPEGPFALSGAPPEGPFALSGAPPEAARSRRARSRRAPSPTSLLASDLAALARAFDRAIYGGLPVAADDATHAVACASRVRAAAGGGA
jgi:hypothetical protein